MATTRKGVDRITKQQLQQQIVGLKLAINKHVDHCPQCKSAATEIRRHCNDWWIIAIAKHKLERKYKTYKTDEIGTSDMLPGMDEL